MREWIAEYQLEGIFTEMQILDHSPIYIGLFADVPATWNVAGRIYFVDSLLDEKLLLGTEQLFFNMVHKAEFAFDTGYNIIFVPVRYLGEYVIKLGKNITQN